MTHSNCAFFSRILFWLLLLFCAPFNAHQMQLFLQPNSENKARLNCFMCCVTNWICVYFVYNVSGAHEHSSNNWHESFVSENYGRDFFVFDAKTRKLILILLMKADLFWEKIQLIFTQKKYNFILPSKTVRCTVRLRMNKPLRIMDSPNARKFLSFLLFVSFLLWKDDTGVFLPNEQRQKLCSNFVDKDRNESNNSLNCVVSFCEGDLSAFVCGIGIVYSQTER